MDSINTPAQANEQLEEIIVQPKAPWLQMNGKVTPEEHLKTITPNWSPETWETYLIWFENQKGQRAESLVSPRRYNEVCESQEESIFVYAQSNADDDLRSVVSEYLNTLTDQQRRVVEMIFWEAKSAREVAQTLGIRHQSILRLKKRALNKINRLLKGGASSRIMRGEDFIFLISKGEENGKQPSNIEDPFAKEAC